MVSCGASARSLRVGEVMLTGEIIPSGGIMLWPNTGLVLSRSDDGLKCQKDKL